MILPPDHAIHRDSTSPASLQQVTQWLLEKDKTITEQEQIIQKKSDVIQSQKTRIRVLEEQLRLQKLKRFGRSSEQSSEASGQACLFNEADCLADEHDADEAEADDAESKASKPSKKKKGRKGLNPDLPRVQERHALSDEEKDGAIDTFWVKVKEVLDIVPPKVQVIEVLQEKAVFLDADGQRQITAADIPLHPLSKAIASVNTLAYLIVAKYQDAMPLYRLEQQLARFGGDISRTTMANWLIRLSDDLLPLINLMREEQWQGHLIQLDETRSQVLKEPGRSAFSDKWMWVMRGGPPGRVSVLFEYDPSRGQEVPLRLLEGYDGPDKVLQTDGLSSYHAVVKKNKLKHMGFRVEEDVTALNPHRPGRAQLTHPVPHNYCFAA